MQHSTQNSAIIHATPEEVYNAFVDPQALVQWQAPGDMKAEVHHFEPRVNGGYEMSLYYPDDAGAAKGKTSAREDRYTARFVELVPNKKIVEAISFVSTDPAFADEMMMEVDFDPVANGTRVTIIFRNIPAAINPSDNEEGTKSSLQKLTQSVEKRK
jgi:uncharacterized protein YndB with AHSA1/START domain